MLVAVRIISGLLVMTFGFAWTVGQAGLETTNRNLCDLVAAVSHQPIVDCHFANWIVWLWGLGALAAFVFLVVDVSRWLLGRRSPATADQGDFSEHVPDVRVADSAAAAELFASPGRDKLIPLLEAGQLPAWGRPMGAGQPALIKVPSDFWRTNAFSILKADEDLGWINQTFLKTKAGGVTPITIFI